MTILVIDDEAAVRDAYRLLFSGTVSSRPVSRADALAEELFGAAVPQAAPGPSMGFEISLAAQGLEGVELAARALQEGTPFKVAFVDVRMPPGIDGKGNRAPVARAGSRSEHRHRFGLVGPFGDRHHRRGRSGRQDLLHLQALRARRSAPDGPGAQRKMGQ
ncbi:hypothetical protein ACTTAF_03220 [Rhodobacter capsulatus]|uniref:hypothetical protein n=1 Tax=Rhodobacter capsulatus TaxID=1061 RepID=UPI0040388397